MKLFDDVSPVKQTHAIAHFTAQARVTTEESLSPTERLIFTDRARAFLLDNERGKRITIRIGETLAREFPLQIARIFIRDLTEGEAGAARYAAAFRDLPWSLWVLFRDPASIRDVLLLSR
ncbi:MAG: hypothetical protein FJ403_03430 [Verrucomicrobia bacterium]|nr:hypothetical protein [Verrucomicrobiota bacterium]